MSSRLTLQAPTTFYELVRDFKRETLATALAQHGGDRTRTARALGLQRTYLIRLLRDLGLQNYARGTGGYSPMTMTEPVETAQ